MSSAEQEPSEIISLVLEMAAEPSYLSEIMRKVNNNVSGVSLTVSDVAQVAATVSDRDGIEFDTRGYSNNDGQTVGSPHFGPTDDGDEAGTKQWEEYTIIHNTNASPSDLRPEVRDAVDLSVSIEDKRSVIDTLSGEGNSVSRQAEEIMKAVMYRQFRHYETAESGGYNDPGVDFLVGDKTQRDYDLSIEVSVRYENPVDRPYIDAKKEKAFDRDSDLVILAPKFTQDMRDKYEVIEDDEWHRSPENEIVHLHRVPMDVPEVYRPFAFSVPPEYEQDTNGFPVILPDTNRVQSLLSQGDKVGGPYPVVTGDKDVFIDVLESVEREFQGIPESGYRNQLREAIEPLLHEFVRPYRIEQYLVDTYWDRGLSQQEIGRLNGVSDRTISEWMSDQHWQIATRGRNTRFDPDTIEIWKKMYRGEAPFPREMTGYEIQALYNKHPEYNLSDWRQWYALDERTRARIMETRSAPDDNASYTVMLNDGERIFPSYDFIIETLRRNGVDIREGFFNETGSVFPTGTALQFMLNRNVDTLGRGDEVGQRDVVRMRSDLEVQVAEWFSQNEIPFAYEPFKIPSSFGGRRDNVGVSASLLDSIDASNKRAVWERIYRKHSLSDVGNLNPDDSFSLIDRQEIVPDFALYPDVDMELKSANWEGWTRYSNIIEVSGPYGAPPPQGFESWYRFRGVAEKELIYKLLGLWDKTYFILTDDEDIPEEIRNDSHYIIIGPTQTDVGLDGLQQILGI